MWLQVLSSGAAEERFLQFASNQDLCRKRWEAAEVELQRLQIELQSSDQVSCCSTCGPDWTGCLFTLFCQEVKKLEMKLAQARELLQSESDLKKKAEQEREVLSQKWELVRELISSDQVTNNHSLSDVKSFCGLPPSLVNACITAVCISDFVKFAPY